MANRGLERTICQPGVLREIIIILQHRCDTGGASTDPSGTQVSPLLVHLVHGADVGPPAALNVR